MRSLLDISADEKGTSGGGGPEDDPRFPALTLRSHGFMALAFGFAMGLTFMAFFGLFRLVGAPTEGLKNFIADVHPNLWLSFLYGWLGGTLIAAVYNLLIFHRLNLFGLDRNAD